MSHKQKHTLKQWLMIDAVCSGIYAILLPAAIYIAVPFYQRRQGKVPDMETLLYMAVGVLVYYFAKAVCNVQAERTDLSARWFKASIILCLPVIGFWLKTVAAFIFKEPVTAIFFIVLFCGSSFIVFILGVYYGIQQHRLKQKGIAGSA